MTDRALSLEIFQYSSIQNIYASGALAEGCAPAQRRFLDGRGSWIKSIKFFMKMDINLRILNIRTKHIHGTSYIF